MTLAGVDVASFQAQPALWQAHAGAIDWAAVKISEMQPGGGKYVNPAAAADWAYLRQRNLGRIAYLYARPATLPSDTVELFLAALEPMGILPGDGIGVDLETADGLPPARVAAWGRAVTGLLRATLSRVPLVYTYLAFAEAGNCAGLGGCPLWMSDPSSRPGLPRVPAPWTSWAVHQWQVTGPIDRDIAAWPTLAAMRAAIGQPATVPPPPRGDAMLLNKGTGAVTPVAVPAGDAAVRLYCAGTATIEYQIVSQPPQTLSLAGFSVAIPLPAGHHAVKITRKDGGTDDICVVSET